MSALPKGWKVISSKYLHKEEWLTVRKDELLLPNGHVMPDYFILEYPDWVNVVAITKEGKLIMLRQYRHGIGRTDYEICAGACDKQDKSPLESAKRELLEETGYGGGEWQDWMKMAPNSSTSNNWVHCYLATGVEKLAEPQPESSEEISVHILSIDEVRELMMNGEIIQATQLTPLWKYLYMLETK
jgi:ADP-ribose pyrophosphatase